MSQTAFAQPWLHSLVACDAFFHQCSNCSGISSGREVAMNQFCWESAQPMCSICSADVPSYKLLQVRRSSYHDVIKAQDLGKLADVHDIQPYVINGSRVLFLKRRPMHRTPARGAGGASQCVVCDRHLQDSGSAFCSLECKLDFCTVNTERAFSSAPAHVFASASQSSGNHSQQPGTPSRQEYRQQQHQSGDEREEYHSSATSRRKGVPRRSPLE